jgi:molecular chaperone DnaK (HSP70)
MYLGDLFHGLPNLKLTRSEFEDVIMSKLMESMDIVNRALAEAKLKPKQIREVVTTIISC